MTIPLRQTGQRVLVCDGAMGTMLHAAGAALDRSLPELNLSDPDLVSTIHESYLSAGADIIQANTFGANRLWLGDHGFPDKVDEINRAGVRIARAAQDRCDRDVLVAGSVSPAVTARQRRQVGSAERAEVIREQIRALLAHGDEPGVDLLILETFGYLDELIEAVHVAASLTDVPVIAQATFADDSHTLGGETPREVAIALSALPVAMVGTNCTIGPQRMLTVAQDLVRYASVPVSAQPNAGQPRRTGPRSFEFSIDGGYFARYFRRFADAGVSLVGGCCGTTPAHIRAAAGAVQRESPPGSAARPHPAGTGISQTGISQTGKSGSVISGTEAAGPTVTVGPPTEQLASQLASGRTVVAAAIASGGRPDEALEAVAVLQAQGAGVFAVQPTQSARTRSDSLDLALHLQAQAGVEIIAALTTWDKTIMTLQAELLGAHALGLRNVICTTGSPPVLGDYPAVDGIWEVDSLGLIALLAGLNAGRDSNGLATATTTSFCIGARVDPGARDPEAEIARARAKVRAGAHFLVSRPVYELGALRRMADALAAEALPTEQVPLLLSVTPLRSFEEADYLANEVPGVSIPPEVLRIMERAGRAAARAAGIDLAAALVREARDLVRGVIVTAAEEDPAGLAPVLTAANQ
jgi:methionine synthase / methylenetetrahydrofolate reductase(NADPH)